MPTSAKLASLCKEPGFVLDWDLVLTGSDWWFWCGTYVITAPTHLTSAYFEPNAVLKYEPGAALYVDGPLTWSDRSDCGGDLAILTSVNDDEHGEVLPWSTGSPQADYGPALVVQSSDVETAQLHIQNLYGTGPSFANPPPVSLLTVTASAPSANKVGNTSGQFTITRVDGDWSQPLNIAFSISGTAVPNIDYDEIPLTATLPADSGSVKVLVKPRAPSGLQYQSTVVLTLQPDAAQLYSVGNPSSDTVSIFDSSSPAPPPLINVDFVTQGYSPSSLKAGHAKTGQSGNDFWNALSCPGQYSATLLNLQTAAREVTSCSLTVQNCPGTWGLGSPDSMYDCYMYPAYGQNGTLTFNALSPGKYNVYLYGYDGNYTLTAGTTSYGTRANRDWPLMPPPLVWTESKQYSLFSAVPIGSGDALTITMHPGVDGWAVISGIQIEYVPEAPEISTQPASQTVEQGDEVGFTVSATGTAPLQYQWSFNGVYISGATESSYHIAAAGALNAGDYKVIVHNSFGSASSDNAHLTVTMPGPPTLIPDGLISWWRSDGDALDSIGPNNGTLVGTTTFGPGRVNSGFSLHANGDGINLGAVASLCIQNFTIEAWIKRASGSIVSQSGNGNGQIFASGGAGSYSLYLDSAGRPWLSKLTFGGVQGSGVVEGTSWHHVAVTKNQSVVIFYVDGVSYNAPTYDPGFTCTAPAFIGAWTHDTTVDNTFYGTIDELSIYSRALSPAEIQSICASGKSGKIESCCTTTEFLRRAHILNP